MVLGALRLVAVTMGENTAGDMRGQHRARASPQRGWEEGTEKWHPPLARRELAGGPGQGEPQEGKVQEWAHGSSKAKAAIDLWT